MALGRYMLGIGLFLVGLLCIFFGLAATVTFSGDDGALCCATGGIIGLLLLIIGSYLAKTSNRIEVKIIGHPQNTPPIQNNEPDRRCPKCGRAIPFESVVCPFCQNDFKN